VVHRHHRAPHPGREGLLRCSPRRVHPISRRLVDRGPHALKLVVDALQIAIWTCRPGTVVQADRAVNTPDWFFGHRLRDAGLLGSMGTVASSVNNLMIESFWSTMQRELLDTRGGLADTPRSWEPRSRVDRGLVHPPPTKHGSECSAPSTTNTGLFTPPHKAQHDHHTTRVRITGAGFLRRKRSPTSATKKPIVSHR